MSVIHRLTLSVLLGILGVSLVIPGLIDIFRSATGRSWLVAESVDAGNHLRALNGMMTGFGLIAFWALFSLPNARVLVIALGVVLATVALARIYAMLADGLPGPVTWVYLGFEIAMAAVFLIWPPPF